MSAPTWPLQNRAALNAFYGNPDPKGIGKADAKWEAANIVTIVPPYQLIWAFDTDADGKIDDPVKTVRVHRLCADPLMAFFGSVKAHYGSHEKIVAARMHLFGGAYVFRGKRGNPTSLSMHAFGCAWDLDPERNGFRQPKFSMPAAVIELAKAQGADAGADWNPPDAMHFQFARIR
jgi:hypothetical protein